MRAHSSRTAWTAPSRLPRAVEAKTSRFLACLDAEEPSLIAGLYLVGSVALGDYHDGRSDIDFVAVTRDPVGDAALDVLARVHESMLGDGPSLDGIYVDVALLRAWPVTPSTVPFSLDGRLQSKPCLETNPATWLCLLQSGVRLRGPDVGDLGIVPDHDRLRRFLVDNLQIYWRQWIAEAREAIARRGPDGDGNAAAASWGVLGTARIACTIATGRIVSKSEAGAWILDAYPDTPHEVIADALAARRGALERLPCTRFGPVFAFMDALIAREERALGA